MAMRRAVCLLRSRRRTFLFDFVGNLTENIYKDFVINLICPESSRVGSLTEEIIDCGPDAVIDIIWARVALLGRTDFCDSNFDVSAEITMDIPVVFACLADLLFVV